MVEFPKLFNQQTQGLLAVTYNIHLVVSMGRKDLRGGVCTTVVVVPRETREKEGNETARYFGGICAWRPGHSLGRRHALSCCWCRLGVFF